MATAGPPRPPDRGAGVGEAAVEAVGDHGEGDDQQALDQGDAAEGHVPRQPAGRRPLRACPAAVQQGEDEQDKGGERQASYEVFVECPVEAVLAAAPAADHRDHGDRPGDQRRLQGPAQRVERRRSARPAVEAGRRCADRRGDRQQRGGGVRGAQPGHQTAPVPEPGPAEGGADGVLLGVGLAVHRLLGLVRPPGAQRQVPQQAGERGGHRGREGEPAAGCAPPAAVRHHRRQETQPGVPLGARARARALPGDEVEGDLAGPGDQQHRQGQPRQPDQQPVQADLRVRPCAVGRIQWARLTTMNGRSSSHRARVPLPEVRLHQT